MAAIYNHYIANTVVSFEETPLNYAEMQARVNSVLEAGYPWLVVETGEEDNNRLLGYAYAYQWNPRSAYRRTAEMTIYLAQGETGKGWGSSLYQALMTRLHAKGIRTVIGGVSLPNPASEALHESLGFTKVAHFADVGYKFDQWWDVGYWQRQLAELAE